MNRQACPPSANSWIVSPSNHCNGGYRKDFLIYFCLFRFICLDVTVRRFFFVYKRPSYFPEVIFSFTHGSKGRHNGYNGHNGNNIRCGPFSFLCCFFFYLIWTDLASRPTRFSKMLYFYHHIFGGVCFQVSYFIQCLDLIPVQVQSSHRKKTTTTIHTKRVNLREHFSIAI